MKNFKLLLLLGLLYTFGTSCNEPTLIGSELVENDQPDAFFSDTMTIQAVTVLGDSVQTYNPSVQSQLRYYMVGRLEDPLFGSSTAATYVQFIPTILNPEFVGQQGSDFVFDSLVLKLRYRLENAYGALTNNQSYKVERVIEDMPSTETYYSDQEFETGEVVATLDNIIPQLDDTILVDSVKLLPHLRVRMDDLGEELFNALPDNYETDDDFLDFFKGLKISGENNNTVMISFQIPHSLSEMTLFYTDYSNGDTLHKTFDYLIVNGNTKLVNFNHDYSNSEAEEGYINKSDSPDSLCLVQSMAGLNTKINFPYASNLKNIIVNKAELVVSGPMPENPASFDAPDQLLLRVRSSETERLVWVEDAIASSLSAGSSILELFGGAKEEVTVDGVSRLEYKMNISSYMQQLVDGTLEDADLYLTTYPKAEIANHFRIGDPRNTKYPMELRLTYTQLQE